MSRGARKREGVERGAREVWGVEGARTPLFMNGLFFFF